MDGTTFRTDWGQAIQGADPRGVRPGIATRILVRPEKIIDVTSVGTEPNRLDGVIESVSFVGGSTRVMVRASSGKPVVFKSVSTRADARARAGMPISLGWSAADSIVLSA